MKQIELTEEHKSKLLEMCKVLFPEYNKITFSNPEDPDACFDSIEGILHLGNSVNENKGFIVKESIHWFEFCMTHLMYKLSYEFSKIPNAKGKSIHIELWELNKGDYFKKHPVDYLYEEFKKLK